MRKVFVLSIIFAAISMSALGGADGRSHFNKAMSLWDNGMWGAAREEFVKAREASTDPNDPLEVQCDYMIAMCASAGNMPQARGLLEDFLSRNPHTIYHNDVRFALGRELYKAGEYDAALRNLLAVDPFELTDGKRSEYFFTLGHSYFLKGDAENAYRALRQVDRSSSFGNPAVYYIAYMDYSNGRYAAAKDGFTSLLGDPAYSRIVPFYLLQLEFLQSNYSYVTANGDKLIETAAKPRAMEVARLMAESWYHLEDYGKALGYMDLYRRLGGGMDREENYIEGYSLYRTGDKRRAVESLSLACGPDDALSQNAAYHMAGCYLDLGDKQRAMQSFSIASTGHYDESIREDALFNYGKLQYDLGGGVFNEAINVLNRYIAEYPDSPRIDQVREYLLAAYYNSRNYEAAYEAIRLIPNPDNNVKAALQKITYFRALEYFNAGDMAEADRLLQLSSANRYNAKYTALASFWRGEILYRQGKFKEAMPFYREFIALSPQAEPEHATAQYALGYSNFNQRNWPDATLWFNRYLESGPGDRAFIADTYNRLGDIKYAGHSFWQAIEEYDKSIKLGNEQSDYALWRRAVLLGMVDRVPRKIESLRAIVDAGKGEFVDEAMYELGRTYMAQERFADAATTLKRYIDTYPSGAQYIDALADLGLVYQNLGRTDEALAYYKRIVADAPNSPHARDAMAGIRSAYVDRNDVEGYLKYAAETKMEGDLSSVARDSLSFASAQRQYLVAADLKTGIAAMRGYLENFPKGAYRAQALYDMGDASLRSGDRNGAKDAYKELAAMYYNEYTVRGLDHLSRMQEEDKEYAAAAGTYRELSRRATDPTLANRALEGYLRTSSRTETADMISVADEIVSSQFAGKDVVRQAEFAKAKALAAKKDPAAAAIFEKLSAESQSPEGAESAFHVIESYASAGNNEEAKKCIFVLSSQNSPHVYWVGRSFLILGDIYVREGDPFQARATLQSIVDGYPNQTDGIVEQAREAIKKLK